MNQIDFFYNLLKAGCEILEAKEIWADLEEARITDERVCGHCDFWMKSSSCPSEKNISGRKCGPSMQGLPCEKFVLKEWVRNLKIERTLKVEKRLKKLREAQDDLRKEAK
jgi:hypothetical protein